MDISEFEDLMKELNDYDYDEEEQEDEESGSEVPHKDLFVNKKLV